MDKKKHQLLPEDTGSVVRFFNAFLDKSTKLVQHIDTQVNIIVGISSAIFVLSASQILRADLKFHWPFWILVLSSGFAAIIALFAIHPPKFMRKRGQKESLLYNKYISSFASYQEYLEELNKLTTDQNSIVEQYAIEIYNMAKYYYTPKRKLFHLSRALLMVGFIFSIISFLIKILAS